MKEQMMDSLAAWMNIEKIKFIILATRERGVLKGMITNTVRQGT